MKLQIIFGLLTIATGLLGGSFTHPAIAKRCCVRPWRLPWGEAQIAHSISSQQTRAIFFGGDEANDTVRWRRCLIHPNPSYHVRLITHNKNSPRPRVPVSPRQS